MLDLVEDYTTRFYEWVMPWYYISPFATVMLAGHIAAEAVAKMASRGLWGVC